jgi:hypothetical protein
MLAGRRLNTRSVIQMARSHVIAGEKSKTGGQAELVPEVEGRDPDHASTGADYDHC